MSLLAREVFRQKKKRGSPERDAQKAILYYLKLKGCLVAVTDAGAARKAGTYGTGQLPPQGWPDLTCCMPGGKFLGVEVKSTTGRQSPQQKFWQSEIERCGGIYILARSIDDVAKVI